MGYLATYQNSSDIFCGTVSRLISYLCLASMRHRQSLAHFNSNCTVSSRTISQFVLFKKNSSSKYDVHVILEVGNLVNAAANFGESRYQLLNGKGLICGEIKLHFVDITRITSDAIYIYDFSITHEIWI